MKILLWKLSGQRIGPVIAFGLLLLSVSGYGSEGQGPKGCISLALDDCLRLALDRNYDILLATEALIQAEMDITQARSFLLPFLGAEGSYTRLDDALGENFGAQSFTFMKEDIYAGGIVLRQPLFSGGKLVASHKAAQYARDAKVPAKRNIEEEIVFQVTRAYWTAQVAEAFQKVAAEAVELLEAHEHDVAILVREGANPQIDLLRTRTELANARKHLNASDNALDLALSALKNLLVINLEEPLCLTDQLGQPPRPTGDLASFERLGINNRPEIAALRFQQEAGKHAMRASRAEYLPTIGLEGRYEYLQGDIRDLSGGDHWTIGVGAQMPLWNWDRTGAKVRKAKSQLEQVNIQLEKLENRIRLEVRQTFLNLGTAEKNIEAATSALHTAREAYRLANAGYHAGVGTNTEVLDARTALTRAEANHLQALFEYNVAIAALERVSGTALADMESSADDKS